MNDDSLNQQGGPILLRDREAETRQPHKLKTGGANPSPATKFMEHPREMASVR